MVNETFKEYLDRVIRARHMLIGVYATQQDYFRGVAVGYASAKEFTEKDERLTAILDDLSGYARRLSLRGKTAALVAQDRVLTYREGELS